MSLPHDRSCRRRPRRARLNRPIAYIQANIHAGEVEGKEAMLAMLRDLLFDKHKNVLDSIVLIVQPIYNADGNEKWGPQSRNRGSQNGPELVGTRQNASGWNLNRDYIGADAPETRGSLAMLNAWNPDLFMDLHTTDGSVHGYALTYAPPLTVTAVNVIPYATKMLADIRQRMLDRDGFYVQDYGDFSRPRPDGRGAAPGGALGGGGFGRATGDSAARGRRGGGGGFARGPSLEQIIADSIPASGWVFSTYEPFARYGTNYYGLRNRVAILSEAFSHDPFARRVASTYDFVSEILSYTAAHKAEIMAIGPAGDAKVAKWANAPGSSPALSLRSRMDTTRIEDVRVEEVLPLTDSTKREAGLGNRQRTGIIKLVRMPVMASFTSDAHQHAPVRLRLRLDDGEGHPADPRRARRQGRSAQCPRHRERRLLRRRQRARSRPFRNVANDEGRDGPLERCHDPDARRREPTSCARGSRTVCSPSTCSSRRAKTDSRSGASTTASSNRTRISPSSRIIKPATLHAHARPSTDASLNAALSLESAARLPVRAEQQPRQDDSRRRFVAGETLDEALIAVRALNAQGHHGVARPARRERDERARGARRGSSSTSPSSIAFTGQQLDANVSVKLTAMGLDISEELCVDVMHDVLDRAQQYDTLRPARHGIERLHRPHAPAVRRSPLPGVQGQRRHRAAELPVPHLVRRRARDPAQVPRAAVQGRVQGARVRRVRRQGRTSIATTSSACTR